VQQQVGREHAYGQTHIGGKRDIDGLWQPRPQFAKCSRLTSDERLSAQRRSDAGNKPTLSR
jgi:hypothetical protein